MTQKNQNTGELALANIDVPTALAKIEQQLNNINTITESNYRTGGIIDGVGDIRNMTKVTDLIKALASIKVREDAYDAAAEALKSEGVIDQWPVFSVNGHGYNDWKQDIVLRIKIVTNEDLKQKLQKAKDTMKQFLTQEEQKLIAMKELGNLLGTFNL